MTCRPKAESLKTGSNFSHVEKILQPRAAGLGSTWSTLFDTCRQNPPLGVFFKSQHGLISEGEKKKENDKKRRQRKTANLRKIRLFADKSST